MFTKVTGDNITDWDPCVKATSALCSTPKMFRAIAKREMKKSCTAAAAQLPASENFDVVLDRAGHVVGRHQGGDLAAKGLELLAHSG